MKLTRRTWLRLAASSALAPLLAGDGEARADAPARMRLILLMQPNGTHHPTFWPNPSSVILEPLLSLPRIAARTTVVKGLYNHTHGAGNEHDVGWIGMWTGKPSIGSFNDPWGAGPSIDQVLRAKLPPDVPFGSINCGVIGPPPLKGHRTSFSYVGAQQPVPTETDPFRLYARLFSPLADPGLLRQRTLERRSILDFAAKDLVRTERDLRGRQREKLQVHATAIRDYERRLEMLATWKGACAPTPPTLAPGLDVNDANNANVVMPAMLDLVALAVGCGLTRIVTFPMGYSGHRWTYPWLGVNKNSHEDVAHKDDNIDPVVGDEMTRISRWHAEQVAYLAQALDAIPEGFGTMLDQTLIVWGNEFATGPHGVDDVPVVMVGGAAGRLRAGGLVDTGPQTYHRVGCTVMNLMGVPADGFGDEPTCGTIRGLDLRL